MKKYDFTIIYKRFLLQCFSFTIENIQFLEQLFVWQTFTSLYYY